MRTTFNENMTDSNRYDTTYYIINHDQSSEYSILFPDSTNNTNTIVKKNKRGILMKDMLNKMKERGIQNIWISNQNLSQFYENPIMFLRFVYTLVINDKQLENYTSNNINEYVFKYIFSEDYNIPINELLNIYKNSKPTFDEIVMSPKYDFRRKGQREAKAKFYEEHKGSIITSVEKIQSIRKYSDTIKLYMRILTNNNYSSNLKYNVQLQDGIVLTANIDYVTDKYYFVSTILKDTSIEGIKKHINRTRIHDIDPLINMIEPLVNEDSLSSTRKYYSKKELIILAVNSDDYTIVPYKVEQELLVESRYIFHTNMNILKKILKNPEIPAIDYIFA